MTPLPYKSNLPSTDYEPFGHKVLIGSRRRKSSRLRPLCDTVNINGEYPLTLLHMGVVNPELFSGSDLGFEF